MPVPDTLGTATLPALQPAKATEVTKLRARIKAAMREWYEGHTLLARSIAVTRMQCLLL